MLNDIVRILDKNMGVNSELIEISSGLLRKSFDTNALLENAELRAVLDKAVDKAELNVTERMALNEQFFPAGDGFELFPQNQRIPKFNFYIGSGGSDEFTKEAERLKIPEDVCVTQTAYIKSSKSNFQANLDNAIKKLGKVLKK